jgi:hypothetical protein
MDEDNYPEPVPCNWSFAGRICLRLGKAQLREDRHAAVCNGDGPAFISQQIPSNSTTQQRTQAASSHPCLTHNIQHSQNRSHWAIRKFECRTSTIPQFPSLPNRQLQTQLRMPRNKTKTANNADPKKKTFSLAIACIQFGHFFYNIHRGTSFRPFDTDDYDRYWRPHRKCYLILQWADEPNY